LRAPMPLAPYGLPRARVTRCCAIATAGGVPACLRYVIVRETLKALCDLAFSAKRLAIVNLIVPDEPAFDEYIGLLWFGYADM
jgi:hypothetical protein